MYNIKQYCKRKKSLSVSPAFIKALDESCDMRKAERLPDGSFYELYIGTNLLNSLSSTDNQIIWGRRGTGKTHLLKAFVQKINDDPNCKSLAFYISCDKIDSESPLEIVYSSDTERMKYLARQTLRSFVNYLSVQITNSFEGIIAKKYYFNDFSEEEKEKYIKNVENRILDLMESCTYGSPNGLIKEELVTETVEEYNEKDNSLEVSVEGKIGLFSKIVGAISAKFKKTNNKTKSVKESSEITTKKQYSFSVNGIREALKKLVDVLEIDTLYVCIDELWMIDSKREISIQPLFLEYIRQAFFTSNNISIKIASIREVTKINSKANPNNSYGLQSGHDITELVNLDNQLLDNSKRLSYYKELLYKRINYFSSRLGEYTDIYDINFIVRAIFREEKYLSILISLSHHIPRVFICILKLCLQQIESELQKYYIHSYLIKQMVMKFYLNEKRSNLPMNKNSLFDSINEYVHKTKNYFFLLDSEQVKSFKTEIDNLVYIQIIHQIPSSALPNEIMDKYKCFFIDSGKYLYTLEQYSIDISNDDI